jgi:hypothetical protein
VRVALEIVLTKEMREELQALVSSRLTSVRLALRAQIVLMAFEGRQNKDIAKAESRSRAGVSTTSSRARQASNAICRAARRQRRTSTLLAITSTPSRSSGPRALATSCRRAFVPTAA